MSSEPPKLAELRGVWFRAAATLITPLGWNKGTRGGFRECSGMSQSRSSQWTAMSVTHLFAGVAVSDFVAARRWYEALFGSPPDMLPMEGEAVWHVTTSGSVYVTADAPRAGSALLTIAVSNLNEHATALAARGLNLREEEDDPSAPRQLTVTDNDGNCIKFFEDPIRPTA
jgi:hypothetical protein